MLKTIIRTVVCALAVACTVLTRTPAFAANSPQPKGVVFYDQKFSSSRISWNFKKQTRDFLTAFGFEAMHTEQILDWLQAVSSDARNTLLVMNTDNLPAPLSASSGDPAPLRRYLDAGGTILWYGGYPGAVVSYQLEPTQYPGETEFAALLGSSPDWTDTPPRGSSPRAGANARATRRLPTSPPRPCPYA